MDLFEESNEGGVRRMRSGMKEAGYTSDVFGIKKNRKSFNEPGGFI